MLISKMNTSSNKGYIQQRNLNISPINFRGVFEDNFKKTEENCNVSKEIGIEHTADKKINVKNIAKYGLIAAGVAVGLLCAVKNKKIINNINSIFFNKNKPQTFEKPKFLYHMTSQDAYNSIMRDGKIKISNIDTQPGVFLSSADDLKKKYNLNDILGMINFYDGGNWANPSPHRHNGKVVILQIPVKKLDNDMINFRNVSLRRSDCEQIEKNWQNFKNFSKSGFSEIIKKPLEFLFKDEISSDKISKVIEIDTNKIYSNDTNYISEILNKLKN